MLEPPHPGPYGGVPMGGIGSGCIGKSTCSKSDRSLNCFKC
jgi:hypothetical protein